jgi:hypothetical protein
VAGEAEGGAVDFAYLEGFVGGDRAVVNEVLDLFRQQADGWVGVLSSNNPGWPDVVHTIKGAARGIGANGLGEICAHCEAHGADGLAAVRSTLADVMAEIAAYRAKA